jgi:hypothetical protein
MIGVRHNMAKKKTPTKPPTPITSAKIKLLAGKGLIAPTTLTIEEVRKLAASTQRRNARKSSKK